MIENKQGVDTATARQIGEGIHRNKAAVIPSGDSAVTDCENMPPIGDADTTQASTGERPVFIPDAPAVFPESPAVLFSDEKERAPVEDGREKNWRQVFARGVSLKDRLRALPGVGYGLLWVKALFKLPTTRLQQQLQIDELSRENGHLADALRQVNNRMSSVQSYIDLRNERLAHRSEVEINSLHQRMQVQEQIGAAHRLQALEGLNSAQRLHRLEMWDAGTRLMKLEQIEALRRFKHLADLLHLTQQENEQLKKQVQALQQVGTLASAVIPQAQHSDGQAQRAKTSENAIATQATLDQFFSDFESAFRGEKEEIKQRLKVYLPYLRQAQKHTVPSASFSVIDVGCGRGEWLELMAEEGIQTLGIDLNEHKVKACLEAGLAAKATDAIAYLREQTAGSLTAVTGFHLIEHLPFEQLLALFDAAYQALQPGGILIFETPNPENLLVGACNFYYDPTHLHPIVPHVAQFMATQRGFAHAEILRLHPYPDNHLSKGDAHVDQIVNRYLFGEQDYALIAKK